MAENAMIQEGIKVLFSKNKGIKKKNIAGAVGDIASSPFKT
jgi:hypothetical protein